MGAWHASGRGEWAACALALMLLGCGSSGGVPEAKAPEGEHGRSQLVQGAGDESHVADKCSGTDARHEVSEYDTSGDEDPDVRKVFLRVGEGTLARLVLICRETDLNADGNRDVVRYYSEEGRPLREEADRDFDGRMDQITVFQEGQILRQEFDNSGSGKIDTKIFFDNGEPLRAERDMKGRSTPDQWRADRWEYYEQGRVVRMGTDVDGDGKVDRWDRDERMRPASSPASDDAA